jgi:hypothetical protein
MIVIRSKLSLFLCFAVLSAAILTAQGVFAAEKVLVMMPNGDTLDGWKLRALKNGEFAEGPLMLQGGMGAVAYRNIRISAPGQ